jgi:hypothetical protein
MSQMLAMVAMAMARGDATAEKWPPGPIRGGTYIPGPTHHAGAYGSVFRRNAAKKAKWCRRCSFKGGKR